MAEPLLTTPQSRVARFLEEAHRDFTVAHFKYSSVFYYEITLTLGLVKMEIHVRPRKDHLGFHALVCAATAGVSPRTDAMNDKPLEAEKISVSYSTPLSGVILKREGLQEMEVHCIRLLKEACSAYSPFNLN